MTHHTRRAKTYIVGTFLEETQSSAVYDYSESRYFGFSGEVSETNINIYDYEERCFIGGSGNNGNFSLYHYGDRKHIDLRIARNNFDGCDYFSRKHFQEQLTPAGFQFMIMN